MRPAPAGDQRALDALARDPEVRPLARSPEHVRLLWEVCQVPDFRNVLTDAHTWLLGRIFRHLRGPAGRLPEDWVASQVRALDRIDGNTDALLARLAAIRTWTYLAHRDGWVADAAHWQEQARLVEDRLSDALHERLTEQFVDRRGAIVSREAPDALVTSVGEAGDVVVQGLRVGRLEGFRFVPDAEVREGSRAVTAAANRALRGDVDTLVSAFVASADEALRAARRRAASPGGARTWRASSRGTRPWPRASIRFPPTCSTRRGASASAAASPRGWRDTSAACWPPWWRSRGRRERARPPAACCSR